MLDYFQCAPYSSRSSIFIHSLLQKMEASTIINVQPRKVTVRGSTPCDSVRECRICLNGEEEGSELMSICGCTGSVQFVHGKCFKEWVKKKAENPLQREQILSPQGLSCEICHQKYRYTYELVTRWVDCPAFRKKLSARKMLAFSVTVFIIIDLILLGIMVDYAINDQQKPSYDIRQPRFFLVYIALGLALLSALYGIFEFFKLFLLCQSFELTPGQSKRQSESKGKLRVLRGVSCSGGNQNQLMQESHMRMHNSNGLVQYI